MLHFGVFELDVDSFELRRDGTRVEVEPQVLEVILHLAARRDRMVRKEELLDAVWGDRFVSESALTSRVKSARQALGDDGKTQSMIRTIHGRGYQFVPHVTDSELSPASDPHASAPTALALEELRASIDANTWREIRTAFAAAGVAALTAADLETWAEAAWWDCEVIECISVRQEAFRRYLAADDNLGAARVAIALSDDYLHRGASTVCRTWSTRAQDLLANSPRTAEFGQLLRLRSAYELDVAMNPKGALDLNSDLCELAKQIDDADLLALSLQDRGRCLIALGRVDEGMAMVDEAMLLAATTATSANVTGRLYCNMLSACIGVGHLKRARDWSDEAMTWCAGHAESGFPGICQIHRTGLRRRMGELQGSIDDLERIASSSQFSHIAGSALVELGEVHLRRGDVDLAEAAFLQAHAHSADATPGLAQVAIERDRPGDAVSLLHEALTARGIDHVTRVRLLPLLVDAAVMDDQVSVAADASNELSDVAAGGSESCLGSASLSRGTVALMQDRHREAADAFQDAAALYSRVGLPFELATARLGLAAAALALDLVPTARIERSAALAALTAAGAVPLGTAKLWLRRTEELT